MCITETISLRFKKKAGGLTSTDPVKLGLPLFAENRSGPRNVTRLSMRSSRPVFMVNHKTAVPRRAPGPEGVKKVLRAPMPIPRALPDLECVRPKTSSCRRTASR